MPCTCSSHQYYPDTCTRTCSSHVHTSMYVRPELERSRLTAVGHSERETHQAEEFAVFKVPSASLSQCTSSKHGKHDRCRVSCSRDVRDACWGPTGWVLFDPTDLGDVCDRVCRGEGLAPGGVSFRRSRCGFVRVSVVALVVVVGAWRSPVVSCGGECVLLLVGWGAPGGTRRKECVWESWEVRRVSRP